MKMVKEKATRSKKVDGAIVKEETERDLGEVPEGKENPFEDSKEVQSEISLQRQYIPEDAEYFIDMISGEIERVSQD